MHLAAALGLEYWPLWLARETASSSSSTSVNSTDADGVAGEPDSSNKNSLPILESLFEEGRLHAPVATIANVVADILQR